MSAQTKAHRRDVTIIKRGARRRAVALIHNAERGARFDDLADALDSIGGRR